MFQCTLCVNAAQDRISLEKFPETPPPVPIEPEILPSKSNDLKLSRSSCVSDSSYSYAFFFRKFKDAVSWHIFSKEMSKKSEVVSLYAK